MNKISTLNTYFLHDSQESNDLESKKEYKKCNKAKCNMKPSAKVVNFLLHYSKSLEAKNGISYQLN